MKGQVSKAFWEGKKVFLTGHTGFKGSWLTYWLNSMGAKVYGYALAPNTSPAIFDLLNLSKLMVKSDYSDIRDFKKLSEAISNFQPEIVIHMAAQPLVRYSYSNPLETYQVNAMGTANILEVLKKVSSVKATVIVTSDKCYENFGHPISSKEDDPMGGYDPYSSSKGCAELITRAYSLSFFSDSDNCNSIASARAGNVIGGGDWSEDRLIPDAIRSFEKEEALLIRNPNAIRPWQHVLEPLSGYLLLAQALYERGRVFSSGWNFGPDDVDARSVQEVVEIFVKKWRKKASWQQDFSTQPHEAAFLRLDCTKAKQELGWKPKWDLETALEKVVAWHEVLMRNRDMQSITESQINEYQYG